MAEVVPALVTLELPWPPSVNHYYRRVGPRTLISREGRQYRRDVQRMVRTERFKLIVNIVPSDSEELYDLKPDPRELRNLAQDPAYRQTAIDLKRRMIELMKESDDPAVPLIEATP